MKMKRTLILAASVALLLTGCTTPIAPAPSPSGSESAAEASAGTSDTLVLSSVSATLSANSLTLDDAVTVVWMADRPTRKAGSYSMDFLPMFWSVYGFDQDAPNAVLTGSDESGSPISVAVVVAQPSVTSNEVQFSITPIEQMPAGVPVTLKHVALVIDSTATSGVCSAQAGAVAQQGKDVISAITVQLEQSGQLSTIIHAEPYATSWNALADLEQDFDSIVSSPTSIAASFVPQAVESLEVANRQQALFAGLTDDPAELQRTWQSLQEVVAGIRNACNE